MIEMAPDTRWFLAVALAVATVVWVTCYSNPPHGLTRGVSTLSQTQADDHTALEPEGSVDLEGRWIGRRLIVKHHTHERRTQFFAQLDADGRWSDSASENQPAP